MHGALLEFLRPPCAPPNLSPVKLAAKQQYCAKTQLPRHTAAPECQAPSAMHPGSVATRPVMDHFAAHVPCHGPLRSALTLSWTTLQCAYPVVDHLAAHAPCHGPPCSARTLSWTASQRTHLVMDHLAVHAHDGPHG